jgi:hypothetical protein
MQTAIPAGPAKHATRLRPAGAPELESRRQRTRLTLFSVPFSSPMSDLDLARLHSSLDLVTYISPKPGVSGASPGVVRLDFWSGLFLERGASEREWVLEGRAWDNPPEAAVHEWHIRAALAARELDPTVQVPSRQPAPREGTPSVPVGRAANKRLSRFRRRLVGLE